MTGCKCDFYFVRMGLGNKAAKGLYGNNAAIWGYCTTHCCPNNGDIAEGEKYAFNRRTAIPSECWIGILKEK